MIQRYNFFLNLLNLFLILIYFIFLNIILIKKEFEYILISLIIINSILKLINFYNFEILKKTNLNNLINNIFYNDRYTKFSVFILSTVIPIYMIIQKDILIIDPFIEKLSFLLVMIFSLIGFYIEFFILERKIKK